MKKLAEALALLLKLGAEDNDLCAEHDVIYLGHSVGANVPSEEDYKKLAELGVHWDNGLECWRMFV